MGLIQFLGVALGVELGVERCTSNPIDVAIDVEQDRIKYAQGGGRRG